MLAGSPTRKSAQSPLPLQLHWILAIRPRALPLQVAVDLRRVWLLLAGWSEGNCLRDMPGQNQFHVRSKVVPRIIRGRQESLHELQEGDNLGHHIGTVSTAVLILLPDSHESRRDASLEKERILQHDGGSTHPHASPAGPFCLLLVLQVVPEEEAESSKDPASGGQAAMN